MAESKTKDSGDDNEEIKPDVIYQVCNDSVIIKSNYSTTKEFYKRDAAGRITEVYICEYSYGELNKEQKLKISYTGNDYTGEFWDTPTHMCTFSKKENSYVYDRNDVMSSGNVSQILDNHGRIIEDKQQEFKYEYNKYGDLISITRNYPITNKSYGGITIEKDEWEYVYDDKGNWIERKGYNTEYYIPSKSLTSKPMERKLFVWERRDIKYLSPEQIKCINDLKRFEEEERQKKIKEDYNANKQQELEENFFDYLYFDYFDFDERPSSKLEIASFTKSFSVENDVYNFTLSDNSEIDNVKFTTKRGGWYISPDKGVIMIPRYGQFGVDWYVLKYDPKVFEKDWFEIDKERVKQNSLKEALRGKTKVHVIKDSNNLEEEVNFIINKIEEPYSNGFISPQISDKQKEKETLDEAEINKKIRTIEMAVSSHESRKNKIKKFKQNKDGTYSFTLKDNRRFKNLQFSFFDNVSIGSTGEYTVYINEEENLVLIRRERFSPCIIDLKTGYINYIR